MHTAEGACHVNGRLRCAPEHPHSDKRRAMTLWIVKNTVQLKLPSTLLNVVVHHPDLKLRLYSQCQISDNWQAV